MTSSSIKTIRPLAKRRQLTVFIIAVRFKAFQLVLYLSTQHFLGRIMSLLKCCAALVLLCCLLDLSSAIGRAPTAVEHNACRVKWSEQVNEVKRVYKDERAVVRAFNKGLDGFPCMTSCRITFRGNVKDMEDIFTPDDVQCAAGPFPRFCQKGRCVLPAKYREEGLASGQIKKEAKE